MPSASENAVSAIVALETTDFVPCVDRRAMDNVAAPRHGAASEQRNVNATPFATTRPNGEATVSTGVPTMTSVDSLVGATLATPTCAAVPTPFRPDDVTWYIVSLDRMRGSLIVSVTGLDELADVPSGSCHETANATT